MTDQAPHFTTDQLVVIMPAFNAGPFIREAIDSVLAQTYTNFDLLVIDDASTDDTAAQVQAINDPRVHLIQRSQNGGIVQALNQGLDLHRHRFFARMDADDRCSPDRFQKQLRFLEDHPQIDLLGTQMEFFGSAQGRSHLPLHHDEIKAGLLFGSRFPHATLMARASVFSEARYSSRVAHMEDLELWLRLVHDHRFATLPNVLYGYRRHDEGVTIAYAQTRLARLKSLLHEPLGWLGITPTMDELSVMASDAGSLTGGLGMQLVLMRDLFSRIRRANEELKVFDDPTLDRSLGSKWQRVFYRLDMHDLSSVWRYLILNRGLSLAQLRFLLGAWAGSPTTPDHDAR